MSMKGMYAYAIQTAQGKFHGSTEERDGKLYFKGTVGTQDEKAYMKIFELNKDQLTDPDKIAPGQQLRLP